MKYFAVLLITALLCGNALATENIFIDSVNTQIAHAGESTETMLTSYLLENNNQYDIAVAGINLSNFQSLGEVEIETLRIFVSGGYEHILVFQMNNPDIDQICLFDFPYFINPNSDIAMFVEADLIGHGRLNLEVTHVQWIIDTEHHTVYAGLQSQHQIVDYTENMTRLWTDRPGNNAIFLFPGQAIHMSAFLFNVEDNSFESSIVGFNHSTHLMMGLNDPNIFTPQSTIDFLNENGHLTIHYPVDDYYFMFWASNSEIGINGSFLSKFVAYNDLPIGEYAVIHISVNSNNYHPLYGYIENRHSSTLFYTSNAGVRGDVSGNGYVDYEDYDQIVAYVMYQAHWDTVYDPEGEINISRAALLFDWVSTFDVWLLNVCLNDPDNYLVADLCIGEEFDFTPCVELLTYLSEQNGNDLIITTTGNVVSIHGTLNGEPWTSTQFLEGTTLSTWTGDIEPEISQIEASRDEENIFTFTLPVGLTDVEIGAVELGAETEVVDTPASIPTEFALYQNYPNPFNPTTIIGFTLPTAGDVNLTVYNVLGEKVNTLANGHYTAGAHTVDFNGVDLPSGNYFYVLQANGQQETKKMILMK
jgi:hypothetical protein